MPYILRHRETGEVLASMQRNHYDLDYYGVKWWDRPEQAEAERIKLPDLAAADGGEAWEAVQAEEQRIKLMNVKLRNNPALLVRLTADGAIAVLGRAPRAD